MLWALERFGLLAAGALTVNLVIGSVVYAAWVLNRSAPTRRFMTWLPYYLLSAGAAAATAILAKIGIQGVPSNLATAIRTVVILILAWAIAIGGGQHHALGKVSDRSLLFLVLSGIATGIS
jgi:hypothetical protein